MSKNLLRQSGGWIALVAGSLEILGLIFLMLFFALELPQSIASTLRFGYLSDVTPIIVAPINLTVIVILFMLQRKDSPTLSAIAVILGTAGILTTAWTNIMFVSGEILLEKQIQLFYISMAFLGPWHILVNALARRNCLLPFRLATFGVLVGVGQLIMLVSALTLGWYDQMPSYTFAEIMKDIRLLISLAISIPATLFGYLGAPIWLVWLGRTLVSGNQTILSPHKLEARS